MKKLLSYFSTLEITLWVSSVTLILVFFIAFDRESYLSLCATLIGVTSLIFFAKGNPIGHALGIVFCILYAIISYSFSYFGEMITYLGMSLPMSVFALISWLRNPYQNNKAEVKVNTLKKAELFILWIPTVAVTVIFYFILKTFGTANLIPSTVSITTSFVAIYLSLRRSPYYALGYIANDIVLIVLWTLASIRDIHYISVTVCFVAFLFNDIYGFINWRRMQKRQSSHAASM